MQTKRIFIGVGVPEETVALIQIYGDTKITTLYTLFYLQTLVVLTIVNKFFPRVHVIV